MTVESSASATWEGDLVSGKGTVRPASGAFPEQVVTWNQRAESRASGTSPEELIAAAHAGCLSMALANGLAGAGHAPDRLGTTAKGTLGAAAVFPAAVEDAKANCPVSKALAAVPITAEATLEL